MRYFLLTVGILVGGWCASQAAGDVVVRKISLSAGDAVERGMVAGVRENDAGDGVVLYDSVLIEDDGPGIGPDADFLDAGLRAPLVMLGGEVKVKKVLNIGRAGALAVHLYAPKGAVVEINGVRLKTAADAKYREVPAEMLKAGDNEIVLSAGAKKVAVKIAPRAAILNNAPERKDRPARSFRSDDGGKTWRAIDGEAMVRLHLVQYASEGTLISPVMDLGRGEGEKISARAVWVRSIAIKREAEMPAGSSVTFFVRTGSTPVYAKANWGEWKVPAEVAAAEAGYLQWKAVLRTADAKVTPVLRKVELEGKVEAAPAPAWAGRLSHVEAQNASMRYTSIPFEYEDPASPRMVALRKKYKLDEVVAGSYSEMEKLVKLRGWVSRQWKYKAPIEGAYPAWDADEILQQHRGFCVQYAIVYMQCCISLGYQARFVFGDQPGTIVAGHEVCEVWSNQYRKWVLMDPNNDEHYVDPASGVPLSMLETHDRLLKTFYPDGKAATFENRPRKPAHSPLIAICKGGSLTPDAIYKAGDPPPAEWDNWTKWLNVRYMPRNNFFAHATPAPIAQGFHWDWSDYFIWHDAQTPVEWCYRNFISRRADVDWSLNEVCFAARYGEKEGELEIQMGTVTPFFQTFMVNVDGGGWKECGAGFEWKLHGGANRVEMRVRNRSGVEGAVSSMGVEYSR